MTTGEESVGDDASAVMRASLAMADAIGKRDVATIATLVTTDFVHRSPGGEDAARARFLEGIRQIAGEIVFVKLESVQIDVVGDGAIATGIQHARGRIDGQDMDDS